MLKTAQFEIAVDPEKLTNIEDKKLVKDVFMALYTENWNQARQHETQRSTVTSIVMAVAAALISFIAARKQTDIGDLSVTFLVIGLGIFGVLFTKRAYERFSFHARLADKYRDAVIALLPGVGIKMTEENNNGKFEPSVHFDKLLEKYRIAHKQDFNGVSERIHLYKYWIIVHMFIVMIGIVLTCSVLTNGNNFKKAPPQKAEATFKEGENKHNGSL